MHVDDLGYTSTSVKFIDAGSSKKPETGKHESAVAKD
jgi:hypothetical protein